MSQSPLERAQTDALLDLIAETARRNAAAYVDLQIRHRVALQEHERLAADLRQAATSAEEERDRLNDQVVRLTALLEAREADGEIPSEA